MQHLPDFALTLRWHISYDHRTLNLLIESLCHRRRLNRCRPS
jgi:hypothetical protein